MKKIHWSKATRGLVYGNLYQLLAEAGQPNDGAIPPKLDLKFIQLFKVAQERANLAPNEIRARPSYIEVSRLIPVYFKSARKQMNRLKAVTDKSAPADKVLSISKVAQAAIQSAQVIPPVPKLLDPPVGTPDSPPRKKGPPVWLEKAISVANGDRPPSNAAADIDFIDQLEDLASKTQQRLIEVYVERAVQAALKDQPSVAELTTKVGLLIELNAALDEQHKLTTKHLHGAYQMLEVLINDSFTADQRKAIVAMISNEKITAHMRLIGQSFSSNTVNETMNKLTTEQALATLEVPKAAKLKSKKPTVVIVGVMSKWKNLLEKKFGSEFDLRLYTGNERVTGHHDYGYCMTNLASHGNYAATKAHSTKMKHISGGLSVIEAELTALHDELN